MKALGHWLLALLLSIASAAALASTGPSVLIPESSLQRIKALALDTALARGWTLIESQADSIIFETTLEQPASDGPPGAEPPEITHLRIRTDLEQLSAGTRVAIQAEERWWSGTAREWRTDVTRRYQDKLQDALRSLQQRWQRYLQTSPSPSSNPTLSTLSDPAVIEPDLSDSPVGLWAYYAERHARAAGCDLHDRGATLVNSSGQQELHRVFCTNRNPVMVRCDNQGCRPSR